MTCEGECGVDVRNGREDVEMVKHRKLHVAVGGDQEQLTKSKYVWIFRLSSFS